MKGIKPMFKKLSFVISLSLILSSCSVDQINAVSNLTEKIKNLDGLTLNLNANVNTGDIEQVEVDNKKLNEDEFKTGDKKVILKGLEEGKHIVTMKHKKFGPIEVPVEVKKDGVNNFLFNPNVDQDQNMITDWELGIDADKDGNIDTNTFFSKEVEKYVIVRQFSGQTNYVPKDKFTQEYRNQTFYTKPSDLADDVTRPLGPKNSKSSQSYPVAKPVLPHLNIQPGQPKPVFISPPDQNPPTPAQPPHLKNGIYLPIPDKLANYKIAYIIIDNKMLSDKDFYKEKNSLIIQSEFLTGPKKTIKAYLIDESGQGILLAISPKQPITNIAPNKNIIVDSMDINYSINTNVKQDITQLDELKAKNDAMALEIRPDSISEIGVPAHPPLEIIDDNQNSQGSVVIDEEGNILGYTDN